MAAQVTLDSEVIPSRRLELAAEQLKSIDLRSLRGPARDDVRAAREAIATALKSVRTSA